jgi:hypothetical protein
MKEHKEWKDRHHILGSGAKIEVLRCTYISHEKKVASITANKIIRNMMASIKEG